MYPSKKVLHVRPPTAVRAARASLALAAAVLAISCTGDSTPTGVAPEEIQPQQLISDAAHAGKPHFYFLPPMVGAPVVAGAFDPALAPSVQICALSGSGCGAVVASFVSGTGSEDVRLDATAQHYVVNWHTDRFDLDPAITYRIRVLVGGVELGFADVDVVNSGRELKNVITNEYIPLLDGRTLPIKFRPEEGFLARIEVTPDPTSVVVTLTKQFQAVATDLHGAELPASFTWTSEDDDLATVDQGGLATGVADGTVAILASALGVTGAATLDVIGVARIEVAPIEATAGPGVTQQFMAILHDDQDDVIVGPTVTWSSSDADVATVDPTGLATAIADGVATISAGAAGQVGTATLFVTGGIVSTIGASVQHSCGIAQGGAAYCWGSNSLGGLGTGNLVSSVGPVAVVGGHLFESIAVGYYATCGLKASGSAWCWGYNGLGSVGKGSFSAYEPTPQPVAGGLAFESITSGAQHACGLTAGGQAWCWGDGTYGALGRGNTASSATPVLISGFSFESLSAGWVHTCGVTTGSDAYCWGYNYYGAVGNGAVSQTFFPYAVLSPTQVVGGMDFTSIHAGTYHTCALDASGAAYCWGYNFYGQLGNGTLNTSSPFAALAPMAVSGGHSFVTLTGGNYHTCGIRSDGAGYCWGYGGYGALGTGTTADQSVPTQMSGGDDWVSLSAGSIHTCGVTSSGAGRCWGYFGYGALGTGSLANVSSPTPILGGLTFEGP